jgi:HD domain-containing protein
MELDALPAWAEEHAATLLADLGARWQHVRGVARQAQRVGQALAPEDRPYLLAAAWLHDVGYAPDLVATAFHPIDGARHVRSLGQERLARLIAYHSSARWEAEALGLAGDLAAFPYEDSATSDALTYCDMTTSPTGQRVTLADRLAEIAERYGPDHLVVRCLQRAHDHLAGAVRRTEERLWAVGVSE